MRLDEKEKLSCVKEAEVSSSSPFMRTDGKFWFCLREITACHRGKFRSTGFENYCWKPSGNSDLEVSSWRRVWRIFRVENLMGDIMNFEGDSDEVGTLAHSGWSWRQRPMQKDWPWIKEW